MTHPGKNPKTETPDPSFGGWRPFLLGFGVLAMLFFVSLGASRSVWLDESFSINLASQSFPEILKGLERDGHPPLYFFLLSVWMDLFGNSEVAVRSLSGLLYILSVLGVYLLGRAVLKQDRAALIAALLFLGSKTAVAHAQNARMYSLLGFLVIFSYLFYERAFLRLDGKRSDAVLYAFFILLGTFTHFWFCFVVLAQSIGILVKGRHKLWLYVLVTGAATLPFAILWLPILFEHQIHNGVADWMDGRSFGLGTLLATLADYYGERLFGGLFWLAMLALILLPDTSRDSLFRQLFSGDHWRGRISALSTYFRQSPAFLFTLLFAISLIAPLLVSQVRPIYRIGSYTIIALPPLVIALAAVLHRFAHRRLMPLFLVALICGAMAVFGWVRLQPETASDRQAANYLLENVREGDVVVFTSLSRSAVEYYLRRAEADTLSRLSFPHEIDQHPGWRSPSDQNARIDELTLEAEKLAGKLRQDLPPGNSLWMFYGADTGISGLLKDELEAWLVQTQAAPFRTGFYNSILRYERLLEPAQDDLVDPSSSPQSREADKT